MWPRSDFQGGRGGGIGGSVAERRTGSGSCTKAGVRGAWVITEAVVSLRIEDIIHRSVRAGPHVLQFDGLHDLLLLPVFNSYPLDRLISPGLPPFDSVALIHFLTSAHLRKLCFLKAYFSGWELYQSNTAALVFFEDANSVEMMAFGSISSYKQLFVFSFSSANDSFDYALLLQHMPPPPHYRPFYLIHMRHGTSLPISRLMFHCSNLFPPLP